MPKKAGAARTGAQRNRAKVQKSFELVRPEEESRDNVETSEEITTTEETVEEKPRATPTASKTATAVKTRTAEKKATAIEKPASEAPAEETEEPEEPKSVSTTPKGSAAARLAARRQANQRVQQRNAATLITAEHFAYVKRDLITIAVLATIMFAAIIILYFTIGRG